MTGAPETATPAAPESWADANRAALAAAIDAVLRKLDARTGRTLSTPPLTAPAGGPFALDILATRFDLSSFERDLVALCAAAELEPSTASRCAAAAGDEQHAFPSFGLAFTSLDDAHWSATSSSRPLRHYLLIEREPDASLATGRIRLAERVLQFLLGSQDLDPRLAVFTERVPEPQLSDVPPAHRATARRAAQLLANWDDAPIGNLIGSAGGVRTTAAAAAAGLGLPLYALAAESLPSAAGELDSIARLWSREMTLAPSALLLEAGDASAAQLASLLWLADRISGPLLLAGVEQMRPRRRSLATFMLARPDAVERRALWAAAAADAQADPKRVTAAELDAVADQFDFEPAALRACIATVVQAADDPDPPKLWDVARAQARQALNGLVEIIEPRIGLDDVVLPDQVAMTLREIIAGQRQRRRVLQEWGVAARGGLGMSVLFAGPSGTGKSMAAEAIAGALRLDLCRIDLSAVVNKYIGETEKNLRRVFDAAEAGGLVLLFDEADALFGRRSEVRDSHDRYANIEVSYLLQRIETYRGIAILTTNMRSSVDSGFLRRLRFIVPFDFPDVEQRRRLWQRALPATVPTEGIDTAKLARLNLAGGSIANMALNAACLAADAGEKITMRHLRAAALSEYAKLEKRPSETEIGGWT